MSVTIKERVAAKGEMVSALESTGFIAETIYGDGTTELVRVTTKGELFAGSTFQQGQSVIGMYCDVPYQGKINNDTRPTPDGKNIIFGVTLDNPILVFGQQRTRISVWSNRSDYGSDTISAI